MGSLPNEEWLIDGISRFLTRHNITIDRYSEKLPQLFEMMAYNFVVSYYRRKGFKVWPVNLQNGHFKYKIQPYGYPDNFSWFEGSKLYRNKNCDIEIHHNLPVEALECNTTCFITPDVSVIKKGSLKQLNDSYWLLNRTRYYFASKEGLLTFCEAKYLDPFPELLFNFIGMLAAMKPLNGTSNKMLYGLKFMAPSLLLAGSGNKHNRRIQNFLIRKYRINVFFGVPTISKSRISEILTID